jgi:predicted MFS family arabinose efflux permease
LAATLSFTNMLGAPLAGFLFDSVGPSTMFYIYAGLTLLALCLLWGAARVSTRAGQG